MTQTLITEEKKKNVGSEFHLEFKNVVTYVLLLG